MREIKFRVWNDYTNEMRYNFEGFTNEFDVLNLTKFFNKENYLTLLQFTGIQDVNGKEVFEGDIVSCEYRNKKYIDVVKWNDEIIGYDPFCTPCDYDEVYYPKNKIILIGNIYENPELLEQGLQEDRCPVPVPDE